MKFEGRPEALDLDLPPEFADAFGQQLARPAFIVQQRLEAVERDLPHHRVQHVLDLAGQHQPAPVGSVSLSSSERKVSISPNTLAVSASVSGVPDIR